MVEYVVGLPFNEDKTHVLLIRKTHPEWQKHKLNGPGGHIESGETIVDAVRRECAEEVDIHTIYWNHFLTIYNPLLLWKVHFLSTFTDIEKANALTDEQIRIVNVDTLTYQQIIPNLRWIIPLALDNTGVVVPFTVEDRGSF